MNCRQNDMARVIAPGRMTCCPSCGSAAVAVKPDTFVRVTQHDGIAWELEESITGTVEFPCGVQLFFRCHSLHDDILRPIRNPGDDEVDQTLVPGYVKTGEVSHA